MAVGFPAKVSYVDGDVFSASDINDTNGTLNLVAPTTNFAAGKNKIINGDFRINQRNFSSSTVGNGNLFCFDRWMQVSSGGTTTWSAQTFTLGSAPVAGYEGTNFLQMASTGQSAAGDNSRLFQKIESVRTFAGDTVTLSFWARATSGTPSFAAYFFQDFGTGGSPSAGVSITGNKVTLSTSWARYSITVSIPSISGKTIGTNNNDSLILVLVTSGGTDFNTVTNSIGIQTTTIEMWGVQVEAGSTMSAFQTASGTIGGELALCQRYLPVTNTNDMIYGYAISTTSTVLNYRFQVTPRVPPTGFTTTAVGGFLIYNGVASSAAPTSITFNTAGLNNGNLFAGSSAGSPTLVAGQGGFLQPSVNAAILWTGCEL